MKSYNAITEVLYVGIVLAGISLCAPVASYLQEIAPSPEERALVNEQVYRK